MAALTIYLNNLYNRDRILYGVSKSSRHVNAISDRLWQSLVQAVDDLFVSWRTQVVFAKGNNVRPVKTIGNTQE